MTGTALSVFRGTEPESFGVELQGIVDGPVAGSRYLLLKMRNDSLRMGSGFSGSPVYFDGRLAGAISHMESNLASQMAMAVPIDRMLADRDRAAPRSNETAIAEKVLPPGSMIAIPLVRGDFWIGSSGTVAYSENGLFFAFGHENFFSGDSVPLPIHRATVHGVIPRLDMSHKESSPLEEIGSVSWDGKSALVGRLGGRAPMAPLKVEYRSAAGVRQRYRLEMLNHARMAPGIVARVARSILVDHLPNKPVGSDLEIALVASIKGLDAPVTINQRFSAEQLKNELSVTSNPLMALLTALLFPLADMTAINAITMTITDLPEAKTARISEASFTRTRARAGDTVSLRVRLNGPFGEVKDVNVPVLLPVDFSSARFSVSVNPGRAVRPKESAPGSVEEIAAWLAAVARSDELVVLAPGSVADSDYPEARLRRIIARTPWNLEGSGEASIAVVGE